MSSSTVSLRVLLLTAIVIGVSGLRKLTITPDRGSTINIRSIQSKGCNLCTRSGQSRQCNTALLLKGNTPVSVEFECTRPEDVLKVEIVRNIECTAKSCDGHIIRTDAGSHPLLGFNREFTWKLTASAPKAVKVHFTNGGLRQINSSESCLDSNSYTLRALQTSGVVVMGKYCRAGPISSAQILNQGSISVDVPAGKNLQSGQFDVSVGEEIKSLAKITLVLPKEPSSTELLSPNYPESFPDDDVMEWDFQVSDKHKTAVQILKFSQPYCLKKETAVEYHNSARGAMVLRLADPQPEQNKGNFSLTLRNCEMDRKRSGSSGLSVSLKVSSSSRSSPVLCKVDVNTLGVASLHIKKLRMASDCEMKMNSVLKEEITATTKVDLSFQDCLPEDVQITAMRAIGCRQLKDCSKAPYRLEVPLLPNCLPTPLNSVTWSLSPPPHGTVELTSPMGLLKQSVPSKPCNDSIIFKVDDDDGTVGQFCSQGAIQKIQIHTNVTITVSRMGDEALRAHVLNVLMKEEISERYVFTVSPKRDTPIFLATPGWPFGMSDYSTISWIVSVPEKMEAHLVFVNVSQPKCNTRHTGIKVQRIGSVEEKYSRREDEEPESEIVVRNSFYLNMSSCMPERGQFSVITKITLQNRKNLLLTILLSVVVVLFIIFVIVLVVVCMVIRKKKKKLAHQVSIYNPNGTSFLPGHSSVLETGEDIDDHEYASIEDTLVYTHLLRKGKEIGIYGETDTYRPFTGPTEPYNPPASKNNSFDRKMEVQVSSKNPPSVPLRSVSHDRHMVDNVIYQAEGQSEEEHSPTLGPRLEPEGGN